MRKKPDKKNLKYIEDERLTKAGQIGARTYIHDIAEARIATLDPEIRVEVSDVHVDSVGEWQKVYKGHIVACIYIFVRGTHAIVFGHLTIEIQPPEGLK